MNESEQQDLLNWGKAYHEAGHAVLQHFFKKELVHISILSDGNIGGVSAARGQHPIVLSQMGVGFPGTEDHDKHICHEIMTSQGGEAAQREFIPDSVEDY